jgi:hypothetical protein
MPSLWSRLNPWKSICGTPIEVHLVRRFAVQRHVRPERIVPMTPKGYFRLEISLVDWNDDTASAFFLHRKVKMLVNCNRTMFADCSKSPQANGEVRWVMPSEGGRTGTRP